MARITRKELKTDRFALEVEHTVDFFDEHRRDIARYGAAALVVILLAVGIFYYRRHQNAVREGVLSQALLVMEAPTGPQAAAQASGGLSFATEEARNQEVAKRFSELATKYSGTSQGLIAEYTLASMAADQGRLLEAEKRFKTVADSGDKNYGSLAKMSLAQIYFAAGRTAEGEALLRSLVNKPTVLVSKDEATIALARGIAKSKPAEARKLVEGLRASPNSAVSQAAIQTYSETAQ
ncbi:MAG TPA: tetratricopeptide repeat protein [Bryobacteraceae bacterium]|nr:tetratricopeptide repeat protein [Bryobacteraceae bacterium]